MCTKETSEPVQSADRNTSNLCVPKKQVNLSSLRTDSQVTTITRVVVRSKKHKLMLSKSSAGKLELGVEVDGENGVAQWSPGAQPLRCQYQLGSSCRIKLHEVLVQKVVQAKQAKSFAA